MSIQSPVGTLDIKNATLRVGKLEVSNIQGVDTALNVTRANSVLIYDDQASTTTFTGFTSSASVRDTENGFLNLAAAYVYWGQKLPNAWVMEFEMDIRSGTSAGPLNVNLYSSTYTGNDGYSILFDDNGDNLVLKYGGSTLATASVGGLFTAAESWQKVVINYERGMVSVSVGGSRKLYYKDIERSTPYTVGEYINFTSSSTDGRKLRKLKITNGSKLVYSGESNVVYTHGSLGIGVEDPSTSLEVSGTTKSTAFVGDGSGITNITSANVNDFGSNVSRIGNLESNVLQLQTEDMTISGKKTFEDQVTFESNILVKGDLLVANTVNMVVSDPIIELGSNNLNTGDLGIVMTRHGATNSNVAVFYDESEDALKLGYTLGGAYDTSLELDSNLLAVNLQGNLEVGTTNLFVDTTTSNVGVGTDAPLARLDVHGTANVGTLTTTTVYGEIAGSNALTASTGAFSGDLEVGTANLFVDTTTSNVGVGTDTPLATLDIQGDVLINSNLSVGPSSNLFVDATTGNVGISNTAPVHTLDIGSNVYIQEGGDTVLYVSGNVSVSNKLTVESFRISSSSSSGLQAVTTGVGANTTSNPIVITNAVNSTSTSTGALALTNGGLGVAEDIHAGGSLTLSGDLNVDTNTLKVDAGQNRVGILTASPQYPLDVHGSANVGTFITTGATVTGDLTVDTQTLKVDSGNDRVGVNTAFPAYTLDVHGAANVGALTTTSVSGDGSGITNILSSSVNDFASNVTRIGTLESGDLTIGGEKTFSSNLEVGTANLFVDTTTGNVGVGTTEPAESLDVVGNLNLQKVSNTASIKLNSNVVTEFVRSKKFIRYPRVALTSSASNGYENGYKVTFSNESSLYLAFHAFNLDAVVNGVGWYSNNVINRYYNGTNGAYSGTTRLASETELGEWIGLEVPSPIKLYDVRIVAQNYSASANTVDEFIIYAKKQSGDTWTNLGKFTGIAARQGSSAGVTVNVNSVDYYKFFALVATKRDSQGAYGISIRALNFFGVPEYDPDADGTNVIMRSVPNVPNTDWLEVYYDGQDYTGTPTSIVDKSGNDITATANNITIDATYNSFEFTESPKSNIIADNVSFVSGDESHSIVLWVRLKNGNTNNLLFDYRVAGGTSTTGAATGLFIVNSNTRLQFFHQGTDKHVDFVFEQDRWYHITGTYAGGGGFTGSKIYIDGVDVGGVLSGSNSVLVLPATGTITIGDFLYNSSYGLGDGSIANLRLFNRALSADEVWQLYAYQKEYFDVSPDAVTFKGGRLGIGTSEPRAVLDVRGGAYFDSPINIAGTTVSSFTGQHVCFPDGDMEQGLVVSANKNKYVSLNGVTTGLSAIRSDESLPVVSLSNVSNDGSVFGVVHELETGGTTRTRNIGGINTKTQKMIGDNRAVVNSLGEGAMWVANTNGNLVSGDYITSSNVAGYGQKQDSEFLANYTVAKITMDCDFNPQEVPVQVIKSELDTYGRIQWEDDPSGATEKAYKIRYLDTSGQHTDEANAVHIAAFVGCTYHCG